MRVEAATHLSAGGLRASLIAEGFSFPSNQRPDHSQQEGKTKGAAAAVFVCAACAEGVSCLDTAASRPAFSFARSLGPPPRRRVCAHSSTPSVFKAHHRAGWCPFPEKGEVVAHVLLLVQRLPCSPVWPQPVDVRVLHLLVHVEEIEDQLFSSYLECILFAALITPAHSPLRKRSSVASVESAMVDLHQFSAQVMWSKWNRLAVYCCHHWLTSWESLTARFAVGFK